MWTDEAFQLTIEGLDQGYKLCEVSFKYVIPRYSIRDHLEERTRQGDLDLKLS